MGEQVSTGKERDKNVIPLLSGPRCTQANNRKLFLLVDCGKYSPLKGGLFCSELENDMI